MLICVKALPFSPVLTIETPPQDEPQVALRLCFKRTGLFQKDRAQIRLPLRSNETTNGGPSGFAAFLFALNPGQCSEDIFSFSKSVTI